MKATAETISVDEHRGAESDFLKRFSDDPSAVKADASRDAEAWVVSSPDGSGTGFMRLRIDAICMWRIRRFYPGMETENAAVLLRLERFHGRHEFTGEKFSLRVMGDGGIVVDPWQ